MPYLPTFLSTHGVKVAGAALAPVGSAGGGAAASSSNPATTLSPAEIAAKKKEREDREAAQKAVAEEAAARHARVESAMMDLQKQRAAKVLQLKQRSLEIGVALSAINRFGLFSFPPLQCLDALTRMPSECATTTLPSMNP